MNLNRLPVLCAGVIITLGGVTMLTLSLLIPGQSLAWTASNLQQVSAGSEDWWYNYDFTSTSVYAANVDWPLRYLFAGYAEVDYAKGRIDGCGGDQSLTPCLGSSGGAKYFFGVDSGTLYWDQDGGIKSGLHCMTDYHLRVYARPGVDQNYSPVLGWYILGSVHTDVEKISFPWGCENKYFSTEDTQSWFDARARAVPGWTVASNVSDWLNYEPMRWADSTHFVESGGYATYVTVP